MLSSLTEDIFDEYILPHLHYHDVTSLIMCSIYFRDLFKDHPFWKKMFLREKGYQHYEKKLTQLFISNNKWNPSMYWQWTKELKELNKCNLIIKNNTKDIPFDIWWRVNRFNYKKITKKPLLPRRLFVHPSYPNNKWMCIPTKEWLALHPYENVGFSFIVNILQLMTDPVTKKTGFIREIREPKHLIPIKGTRKQYENYKKQSIRIKSKKIDLQGKITKNDNDIECYKEEITVLQKKLNIIHGNYKRAKDKKKDLEYLSNIIK